jgi:hypothetical protein
MELVFYCIILKTCSSFFFFFFFFFCSFESLVKVFIFLAKLVKFKNQLVKNFQKKKTNWTNNFECKRCGMA